MWTIGDLSRIDEHAQFRNDVQLSAFDDPEQNLSLLRSYIFSTSPMSNQPSSLELLKKMVESFKGITENRMVAIARYGHGKSHLGLALANFFSKPVQSEELTILYEKIANASTSVTAGMLRDFKESKGEFLVIRLRGDSAASLKEQFLHSLRKALDEHEATIGRLPPLWFTVADEWLAGLDNEQQAKANAFLEPHRLGVVELRAQLRDFKESTYSICQRLFQHITRVPPNFGGAVEVSEVIKWLGTLCGPEQPLAGVLILFDEFTLYVQKYAKSGAVGELQELLNGVEPTPMRRKVLFLALAQEDPNTTADNEYRRIALSSDREKSLGKELERLPKTSRFSLYSLLESVIDAYLSQPEDAWDAFLDDDVRGPQVAMATRIAYQTYKHYYNDKLHWDFGTFRDKVTKGCFPLHPLSTALLCQSDFQSGGQGAGTSRTILGFVLKAREERVDRPAAENGHINWVLPVELVDYFENRLPADLVAKLRTASMLLDSEHADSQRQVLKALLLQELAGLTDRDSGQIEMVAQMVGLDVAEVQRHLERLGRLNAIRYEPEVKRYSLWPVGSDPHKLETILAGKLQHATWDAAAVQALNEYAKGTFGGTSVSVAWGHPEDWRAPDRLVTVDGFTASYLEKEARRYGVKPGPEWREGERGLVVWLVAGTDADVQRARELATEQMDSAIKNDALPVVVVVPHEPVPDLLGITLRLRALKGLSTAERNEAGSGMYTHELNRQEDLFKEALRRIAGATDPHGYVRPNSWYVVPLAYRTTVTALGATSVKDLLKKLYSAAYASAPPAFLDNYRVATPGPNKLRDAVKQVAHVLVSNGIEQGKTGLSANPVGKQLLEVLQRQWRLLADSGRVQVPDNPRMRAAWDLLDSKLVAGAGEVPVGRAFELLMNPPYGYDYYTATLLFCAWIGYHQYEVTLSAKGQVKSLDYLASAVSRGGATPKDFVVQTCIVDVLTVKRRKAEDVEVEFRKIIERAEKAGITQTEAAELLQALTNGQSNETLGAATIARAQQAYTGLAAELELAEAYDKEASRIEKGVPASNLQFSQLVSLLNSIRSLKAVGRVQASAPTIDTLHSLWHERATRFVDSYCQIHENIQKNKDQGLHERALASIKSQLESAKLEEFLPRVNAAIKTLEENVARLTVGEREEAIRAELRTMQPNTDLKTLLARRKRLEDLQGVQAPETVALRDKKAEEISAEINRLEDVFKDLTARVDALTTSYMVAEWQRDNNRAEFRFQGSAKGNILAQLATRVEQLAIAFKRLEALKAEQIRDPVNAREIAKQLQGLEETYQRILSPSQRAIIATVRANHEQLRMQRTDEAKAWLRKCEHDFRNGSLPHQLQAMLNQPPAFLPDSEAEKLETLRNLVQARIDEDVVSDIVARFAAIHEPAVQKRCLERIQALVQSKSLA